MLCVSVSVVPAHDTSNGATVALLVDVDVCSSLVDRAPVVCDRGSATLPLGPTGVTGVTLGTKAVGPTTERIPQVCFNTTCVGPFEHTIPSVDVPCVSTTMPIVIVVGQEVATLESVAGTC